jgi:hypothetical protein
MLLLMEVRQEHTIDGVDIAISCVIEIVTIGADREDRAPGTEEVEVKVEVEITPLPFPLPMSVVHDAAVDSLLNSTKQPALEHLQRVARASPPVIDGWNWQDFWLTGRMPVLLRLVGPIRTPVVAARFRCSQLVA